LDRNQVGRDGKPSTEEYEELEEKDECGSRRIISPKLRYDFDNSAVERLSQQVAERDRRARAATNDLYKPNASWKIVVGEQRPPSFTA